MMLNLFTNKKTKRLEREIQRQKEENLILLNQLKELKSELAIAQNCCRESDNNNYILLKNAEELRDQIKTLEKIVKSQAADYDSLRAEVKIEKADKPVTQKKTNKTRTTKAKKETTSKRTSKSKK